MQFFGLGGMTAERYDVTLMEQLKSYKPHYVFLNISGNDIRHDSSPKEISRWTKEVIDDIRKCGVRKIFFVVIIERGKFRDRNLTKKSFNAQRSKVNKLVSKMDGVGFVPVKFNFPKEYLKDKVHLNEAGYYKFVMRLRHVMTSLHL